MERPSTFSVSAAVTTQVNSTFQPADQVHVSLHPVIVWHALAVPAAPAGAKPQVCQTASCSNYIANKSTLCAVNHRILELHVHALLPGTLLSYHNSTVMLVNLLTCSSCANVHRATPTSCRRLHNVTLLQLAAELLHGVHALGVAMRRRQTGG
jgi:hypothetical protein